MTSRLKIIEGLKLRFIVEEVNDRDRDGGILLYVASLYLQVRGRSGLHLIRRSRVPGAAAHLERDARLGRIDVSRIDVTTA